MIAKISTGLKSFTGIVTYHENKVSDEKATIIHSSIGQYKKADIIYSLNETGKTNNHVENKGYDISFNFNKADVVSNDKALLIMEDYLLEMGFEGNPYVVYQHEDKEHQHYHIVVSTVDELGKHNSLMNGFYKLDSQKFTRELEVKYNLVSTNYSKNQASENLKSINAEKFSLQKGILKGLKNPEFRDFINEQIVNVKDLILKEKLNNDHLSVLLGENFNPLNKYLKEKGIVVPTLKTQLVTSLDNSLRNTDTIDAYIKDVEAKGFYIRHVKGDKGFVYGINDPKENKVIYFKENNLPERFMVSSFMPKEEALNLDSDKQKSFIKNNVARALKRENTIDGFVAYLKDRNIDTIISSNSKGINGMSFVSNNVITPFKFKASQLDRKFSWNNIKSNFTEIKPLTLDTSTPIYTNETEGSILKIEKDFNETENLNPIDLTNLAPIKKHDQDEDEDQGKSWKSKKKGR